MSTDRRLHCWTLPYEQCIEHNKERRIPVSTWQAALPVWRVVVARTENRERYEQRVRHEWRRALVEREQKTMWVTAECVNHQRWRVVDAHSDVSEEDKSVEVQHVEVLRHVDW